MSLLDTGFVWYGYLEIAYLPEESGPLSAGYILESDFNALRDLIDQYGRMCEHRRPRHGKRLLLQRYTAGRGGYLQPNGKPLSVEPCKMATVRLLGRRQANAPKD